MARKPLKKRIRGWLKNNVPWIGRAYANRRKGYKLYGVVEEFVRQHAPGAKSLLDVGGGKGVYIERFADIPARTVVDVGVRLGDRQPGVEYLEQDFMKYERPEKADVVLCLQVMEHLDDPKAFAGHLLECGRVAVVSVPYKWPKGKTSGHVQDPIDEEKFQSWFPVPAAEIRVVEDNRLRMVGVFVPKA